MAYFGVTLVVLGRDVVALALGVGLLGDLDCLYIIEEVVPLINLGAF